MKKRLVFLVPGFFGFTTVGAISYFEDVERSLGRALRRRGVDARIVRCTTQPTASIPDAPMLCSARRSASGGFAPATRTSWGIDRRTRRADAPAPGVRIAGGSAAERVARLTRTAISVSTPHHGTPLANHFLTVQGQTLLLALTALATSGQGRRAIFAAAQAIAVVAQLDDWLGRAEGPLDRIAASLLRRIRIDRRDPVWRYLDEIEKDQGGVLQLTPAGMALFGAAVADHAGINYGCVVTGVPKPREDFKIKELVDPEYVALRALFRLLHGLTAELHPHYPYPIPTKATQRLLDRGLRFKVTPRISDGVVPALSQLHGRVVHVARADHLDVVGHYTLAGGSTGNWLPSGAGFTREAFEAVWDSIAAAIASGAKNA